MQQTRNLAITYVNYVVFFSKLTGCLRISVRNSWLNLLPLGETDTSIRLEDDVRRTSGAGALSWIPERR